MHASRSPFQGQSLASTPYGNVRSRTARGACGDVYSNRTSVSATAIADRERGTRMPDPDSSTPPAAVPSAGLADALLGIARRASPLAWRLAHGAALPATGEGGDAVETRLATWCQA